MTRAGTASSGRERVSPAPLTATWQEVLPEGGMGAPRTAPVELDPTLLRDLHRRMAVGRRVDTQALTLARQGMLCVYASCRGQEATQVAAAAALRSEDWLFPSYRETVAAFSRGVDVIEVLTLFRGSWHCGHDPAVHRVAPLAVPLATQAAHAAGLAMAARLRGDPIVALAFLGDGAASEGDAHEAMNIAAVSDAPCVFVVQNNQYAISVPLRLQTRASSLALRAAGYGMRGYRVDGNDVVSVLAVVREAVERARAGGGPALVEAVTYRVEAHTTADDPSRYRSAEEAEAWRERDPLTRHLRLLHERGLADAAFLAEVDAEGERVAARMREVMAADVPGDGLEMFDHVYARPTPALEAQRALLAAELVAERETA